MTIWTRAVLLVVISIALQSCSSQYVQPDARVSSVTVAEKTAGQGRSTCPPRSAVPADWPTVVDSTNAYELRMPSSFTPVSEDKYYFIHGGQRWESGEAKVSLSFGHWAELSFDKEEGQRCRVSVGDANVFVIAGPHSIGLV